MDWEKHSCVSSIIGVLIYEDQHTHYTIPQETFPFKKESMNMESRVGEQKEQKFNTVQRQSMLVP